MKLWPYGWNKTLSILWTTSEMQCLQTNLNLSLSNKLKLKVLTSANNKLKACEWYYVFLIAHWRFVHDINNAMATISITENMCQACVLAGEQVFIWKTFRGVGRLKINSISVENNLLRFLKAAETIDFTITIEYFNQKYKSAKFFQSWAKVSQCKLTPKIQNNHQLLQRFAVKNAIFCPKVKNVK